MDIYLVKLILAHFIGDFFLQPNSWVADKEQKKVKSSKLYLHVAVHIALIFIVFFSFNSWKIAFSIGFIHFCIDVLKSFAQRAKTARLWFFIDQALHVISIVLIWHLFYGSTLNIAYLNELNVWIIGLAGLFLTMPVAILMRVVIAKWLPPNQQNNPQSLQNAGKYIGILERLLIFLFVLTHHFDAVGFLLAAKSIFRFGDLKEAHDIKLTEYVLIGTLLSFGLAIVTAIFVGYLIAS
ncbi:DUF3307 domain-containing protein [Pedobacter sp. AW1-32]|uniref:DUF3307 domain-containing protein n=1 Tax=Pedobacter sp. AW1-32 TaxID=3383026 RepID=UPI003FEF6E16